MYATTSSSESARIAARDAAVVCDLGPLRLIAAGGSDALPFLQGQLSADINALAPGTCRYASFNSPKGRMLANFVLWREGAAGDEFRLLLPEDIAAPIVKRLTMYRLRSKVTLADISHDMIRLGIGGPTGADALRAGMGSVPAQFATVTAGSATILGLPGSRFVVLSPLASADGARAKLLAHATPAEFDVWQWLTIRAGVPVVTAATQDAFVAQTANWDILGGIDFKKGCYTGQEIIARMQYLGRVKERTYAFHVERTGVAPGERLYSAAFAEQPCGTVVNAAPAPEGGSDLLAVLQIAAAERGDARLGASDGPLLAALALPYPIPVADPPRGRLA